MLLMIKLWNLLKILRNLPSKLGMLGVVVVVLFFLFGCSNQPSFQEGSAQLKVETELAKIQVVKSNIGALRSSVMNIPDYLREQPPTIPPSELEALKVYLSQYKCVEGPDLMKCHRRTVVQSIEMANRADQNSDELYGTKVTVHQLLRTIDRIYAILDPNNPTNGDPVKAPVETEISNPKVK